MPAYNEADYVGDVIRTMPALVDYIIAVDDGSADGTSDAVTSAGDSRVTLIRHDANQGLGGSLIDAHLAALKTDADVSVVMAGDGQMDPAYLPSLLDPIIDENYDFTKGNRFFSTTSWHGMPRHRLLGNVALSIMTKAATGYWNLFDPQNGYTAMTRRAQEKMAWAEVARDYTFENDVLARLGLMRARLKDVDIPAVYGTEISDIRLGRVARDLSRTLRRAFWRRFWLLYVVRSFSPVALLGLSGVVLLLWSLAFGTWVAWDSIGPPVASTATVMIAVLPFLMGFQLVLAALVLDILNSPR